MSSTDPLRAHLLKALDWGDAHVDFDAALKGLHADKRGVRPPGGAYSVWELLEHMRIAQHDILDFCVNPDYEQMSWPDDYWPSSPAPPSPHAWDDAVARIRRDRETLQQLVRDVPDLFAGIPHGSGQTYLREVLLVADHTAYHVGQLVLVRRLLGVWTTDAP
jgi:uncharacterized damage-inducible protein DinB